MMEQENWWKGFYDELLAEMLLVRPTWDEVDATCGFILSKAGVSPGARLFDQCCGIGSLTIPLASAGYHVIGVDQSEAYIARACRDATESGPQVAARTNFVVSDAFDFVPKQRCAVALNWWTSFGYADDTTNLLMLQRAYEALDPGGVFLLDTMNLPGVFRHFQPDVVTERETSQGRVTLHRHSRFDLGAGRILKTWTYFVPGAQAVRRETSVRLYLPSTLTEMLVAVGFERVELFGGIDGAALGLDDPRCICLARRPA